MKPTQKKETSRLARRQSHKAGMPPGSVIYLGEQKVDIVRITVLDYDTTQFLERKLDRVEDVFEYKNTPTVSWINIDGLHTVSVIEAIGTQYALHPLIQEDIVSPAQRPKLEDMEAYLYVVLPMLHYDDASHAIRSEQVSLVLGNNFVISFQESIGDVFEPIRDRIRHAKGRIRKMGPDYLVYALLDAIVDNYFLILEKIGERIEVLEDELVTNPTQATLGQIHQFKREMIFLRRSVWPLREMIGNLGRSESALVNATTGPYLRDVHDHTIQVIDTLESFRDMVTGMLDTYLSSISNQMNNIMKVLTIISTTFIPLTFVAGVYGMNFKHMPEIGWTYGYLYAWIIMITMLAAMLIYFRRKKWL